MLLPPSFVRLRKGAIPIKKLEENQVSSLFVIEEIDKLQFKPKGARTVKLSEKYKKDFAHYKNVDPGSDDYYKLINEIELLLLEIRVLKKNKSKTDITSKVNICHGVLSVQDKFTILFRSCRIIRSNLFEDIEIFLTEIKVYKKDEDVTSKVSFITGFQTTIRATLTLFDLLQEYDHDFIATRRLNQDGLENFFGQVRRQSGNCTNPTSRQFGCVYNQLSVLKIIDHCDTFNCEDDGDEFLVAEADDGCRSENKQEDLDRYFDDEDFDVKEP